MLYVTMGAAYPLTILAAIIATANHFILDAVAGAFVCVFGWWVNSILLNLLPIEDYFLWVLRMHKPERQLVDFYEDSNHQDEIRLWHMPLSCRDSRLVAVSVA